MLVDQVALSLPMSAAAPARARHAIARLELAPASSSNERTLLDTAILLTSELVSNAVRHSGASPVETVQLEASAHDGVLRVSVTDAGVGFIPTAQLPAPGVQGGFGLLLVEQLAERWGVETGAGTTTVWLELAL